MFFARAILSELRQFFRKTAAPPELGGGGGLVGNFAKISIAEKYQEVKWDRNIVLVVSPTSESDFNASAMGSARSGLSLGETEGVSRSADQARSHEVGDAQNSLRVICLSLV